MPGLLQLRAKLAADISHVCFWEVKLDFELYYIIRCNVSCVERVLQCAVRAHIRVFLDLPPDHRVLSSQIV